MNSWPWLSTSREVLWSARLSPLCCPCMQQSWVSSSLHPYRTESWVFRILPCTYYHFHFSTEAHSSIHHMRSKCFSSVPILRRVFSHVHQLLSPFTYWSCQSSECSVFLVDFLAIWSHLPSRNWFEPVDGFWQQRRHFQTPCLEEAICSIEVSFWFHRVLNHIHASSRRRLR